MWHQAARLLRSGQEALFRLATVSIETGKTGLGSRIALADKAGDRT
jgi:hypothetical protein